MKKWLLHITGALTFFTSALPLTGCTFNFYVNQVKEKIAENLATQTSAIIKSLIIAQNLNSNSQATINDLINLEPQLIIKNNNKKLNNFGDFIKYWGYNQQLDFQGFDQDKLIVGDDKDILTKKIKNLNNTNDILQNLNYINVFSALDNQTLYGATIDSNAIARPSIVNFFTLLQEEKTQYWTNIKDIIVNYEISFLKPISNLLNILVDGWNEVKHKEDLSNWFSNWKDDENNKSYSQWTKQNKWTLKIDYYQSWKINDINLYYGGVLINYLFYKIGQDNNFNTPQYLGDIISHALATETPEQNIIKELKPYWNLLLKPKYILLLITGLLPLIKEIIFNLDDISQGVKHITLGNNYPTNKNKSSFNLKEIFINLTKLFNDKAQLKLLIERILTSTLFADIKIKYQSSTTPLSELLKLDITKIQNIKNELVNTLLNTLTNNNKIGTTLNSISSIFSRTNDQFLKYDGIDLNLESLKTLLIGENGLLTLLKQVTQTITNIIKPDQNDNKKDENEDLKAFYTSLGGQVPQDQKGIISSNFRENTILSLLQKELKNDKSALNNLARMFISNNNYQGFTNILISDNQKWIQDNYTNHLLTSSKTSKITNIKLEIDENSNEKIFHLNYQLFYQFQDIKYHFFIKAISINNKNNYIGVHDFKFQTIYAFNY